MEQLGNKALDMLKALADKVGLTVEQVFPYLVRQAWIESVTDLATIGGLAAVLLLSGVWMLHHRLAFQPGSDARDFLRGFGIASCLIGAVVLTLAVGVNLPGILNPEYYAIRDLMRLVAGGCKG